MNALRIFAAAAIGGLLLWAAEAAALDAGQIVRLKKAGISDATIEAMTEEKTVETCRFRVAEIIALKRAGVSDDTIRWLVRRGSYLRNREPIRYGDDVRPLRLTSAADLVRLKQAGISDEVLRALIVYGARAADRQARREAWRMLENLDIVIDGR